MKSDRRRPAIALESHSLAAQEGDRSSRSEFPTRFHQPAIDSTSLLPLPAEARRRKKVRVVYQTFAILKNIAAGGGVSPPAIRIAAAAARLLRPTARSCNISLAI
jgi:hypothetical protein